MVLCTGKKRKSVKGASSNHKGKGRKASKLPKHRRVSGILATLFYIFALVLAAITLSSCSYSNSFSKSLYVTEIRRNATQTVPEMHLSVGYFGGCVTIVENAQVSDGSSNRSDTDAQTRCIMNMYAHDEDDLLEELTEEFENSTNPAVASFLNSTLPQARHLQKDVFHFAVPVIQVVLFILGGAMLFTASTNIAPKKSYRYLLVLAFLLTVFAMGLMFATAFGSLQALHGLVNEQDSELPGWFMNKTDTIHFADRLYTIQLAQGTTVICFAICMGLMFAGGMKPKRKGAV